MCSYANAHIIIAFYDCCGAASKQWQDRGRWVETETKTEAPGFEAEALKNVTRGCFKARQSFKAPHHCSLTTTALCQNNYV